MRWIRIALLCGFGLAVGCEPPPKNRSGVPANQVQPPADPAAGTIQAEDATGVWNQSQVDQYLRETIKLVELQLTPVGNNGYTATGRDGAGNEYTIQVKQAPGGIRAEWTSATGSGRSRFGNPVP